MTWVLGTNTPFGYAVGLSDIRVTVGNEAFDCLQKVYEISRFVVAGFAGSVEIGFAMVNALQQWLGPIPADEAVVPQDVATRFPRLAQSIFERFPPEVRAHRSHVILFCVDPLPDETREPRSEIYVFRDPDFIPEPIHAVEVVSIGCGTLEYEEALLDFNSNPFNHLQFATAGPGGVARVLGSTAKKTVQEKPTVGVSPHLHACVVSSAGIVIRPNDEQWWQAGQLVEDFKMPWVAQSKEEIDQFLAGRGLSSAQAICSA
jgi:hypothetical protein